MKIFGSHGDCIMEFLEQLSIFHKDKINFLDIGCGDGTRTVCFKSPGRKLCGVDRLDWRKDDLKQMFDFKKEDFLEKELSCHPGAFDLIFSFDVIEHLPKPQRLLNEARRLLADQGVFIISTPNRHRILNFLLTISGLKNRICPPDLKKSDEDPYTLHVKEYTAGELKKLLEANGFKVLKVYRLFYGMTGGYGFLFLFNLPFFHNIIIECQKK